MNLQSNECAVFDYPLAFLHEGNATNAEGAPDMVDPWHTGIDHQQLSDCRRQTEQLHAS